jgi:DNA-directed RNA polymerase omega subunit
MNQRETDEDRLSLPEAKPPDQPWFIPIDEEQSVYRFIIAASKRARKLQAGARPLISTTSRKPTKIAMEEIRQGSVEVELNPVDKPEEEEEVVVMEEPIV